MVVKGSCRIAKFYEPVHTEGEEQPEVIQQLVVRKIYNQICSRPDSFCNYLEGAIPSGRRRSSSTATTRRSTSSSPSPTSRATSASSTSSRSSSKRAYAAPAFSPAARALRRGARRLDKCFENVCELDLIFHSDRVHYILDEIVMAGMVLDTNINNVLKATRDMLHQVAKLNDPSVRPSRLSPSQRAAGTRAEPVLKWWK
ncbi:hypothetical protein JL721_6993 [Aureococcus anophagefferens]|nr:hypothetical protein JL721_6993 [Aureococcus anophagefferens]